jgi:hypothetical protein
MSDLNSKRTPTAVNAVKARLQQIDITKEQYWHTGLGSGESTLHRYLRSTVTTSGINGHRVQQLARHSNLNESIPNYFFSVSPSETTPGRPLSAETSSSGLCLACLTNSRSCLRSSFVLTTLTPR